MSNTPGEWFLLVGKILKGSKKIPFAHTPVMAQWPANHPAKRASFPQPPPRDLLSRFIARNKNATRPRSVFKQDLVIGAFWKRVDRTKDIPSVADQSLD